MGLSGGFEVGMGLGCVTGTEIKVCGYVLSAWFLNISPA